MSMMETASPAWMQPKRPAGNGGAEEGPAAVRRKLAEAGTDKDKLLKLFAKLILNNSQTIREITGMVWKTFLVKADGALVVALEKAGKQYAEWVVAEGRAHGRGPPYLHVWAALVSFLRMSDLTPGTAKSVLQQYWEERVMKIGPTELSDDVRHCRLRKTFKKTHKKFQLAVTRVELEAAVQAAVGAHGGERKAGPPPRSELERAVQRWLETGKVAEAGKEEDID